MEHSDQKRVQRVADGLQEDRAAQRRNQFLRFDQHSQKYRHLHSDLGIHISEERKDRINKDINIKEIRILDFTVLLNTASTLKKERDENSRGEVTE